MLKNRFSSVDLIEAGADEAGRGCLAGPVYAAAVILPHDYKNTLLNDSKVLTSSIREKLRFEIEKEALSWSVASVSAEEIDEINILQASIKAMHIAIRGLSITPQLLLIDGNRFNPFPKIKHQCIIKGDGLYMSIAAASILAKTYRDEFMQTISNNHPDYGWEHNMGYPTPEHRSAIFQFGFTPWHRKTFHVSEQLELELDY
ncbi:MAG TPA: ribonuclease HII [Lentimicrobium sp.]|nr:ribonuclease HII [Lentimicrobium sp.]